MREVHIIYACIHSRDFLPIFELAGVQDIPLQHISVRSTVVSNPRDLEETMTETMLENTILFTNFPPDSYYPEHRSLWRESSSGDELSKSWKSDSYNLTKKMYASLFYSFQFNAIYFITGAPKNEILSDELEILKRSEGLRFFNPLDWQGQEERYRKEIEKFIQLAIVYEDYMLQVSDPETQYTFLERYIFSGLEDIGYEGNKRMHRYFTASDFRKVLNRLFQYNIGIYGMHSRRKNGSYGIQLLEWNGNDPTDPKWYLKAFDKLEDDDEETRYFSAYTVPEELVSKEFGIKRIIFPTHSTP